MKRLTARSKLLFKTLRLTHAFSAFWVKLAITKARTYAEGNTPSHLALSLKSESSQFWESEVEERPSPTVSGRLSLNSTTDRLERRRKSGHRRSSSSFNSTD